MAEQKSGRGLGSDQLDKNKPTKPQGSKAILSKIRFQVAAWWDGTQAFILKALLPGVTRKKNRPGLNEHGTPLIQNEPSLEENLRGQTPLFSFYLVRLPSTRAQIVPKQAGDWTVLHCAHRGTTVSSWGLCEQ